MAFCLRAFVFVAVAIPLLSWMSPTVVHAQPATDAIERAAKHYSDGEFELALRVLQHAINVTKDSQQLAQLHLSLGVNYAVIGFIEKARAAFRTALAFFPTVDVDPHTYKPSLVNLFRDVRSEMTGELWINLDREDVTLWVDKERVQELPYRKQISVGTHDIEVLDREGKQLYAKTVIVSFQRSERVNVKLAASHAESSAKEAVASSSSSTSLSTSDSVRTTPLQRDASSSWSWISGRRWTWFFLGSTALGATLSTIFWLRAKSKADEANRYDAKSSEYDALAKEAEGRLPPYYVALISTAVLGATTIAFYVYEGFRSSSETKTTSVTLEPYVTLSEWGGAVRLRF